METENQEYSTAIEALEPVISVSETLADDSVMPASSPPATLSGPPPPPQWPEVSSAVFKANTQLDPARHILHPLIPHDQVPRGWSNNFKHYWLMDYGWNKFYGGIQWNLNEVFHIPGQPRLLLFALDDDDEEDGGQEVLIGIGGQYVIRHSTNDTVWVPDGRPSLHDVLRHLRGDIQLTGQYLNGDETVQFTYMSWHHRLQRANTVNA